jgi:hypothetical protein
MIERFKQKVLCCNDQKEEGAGHRRGSNRHGVAASRQRHGLGGARERGHAEPGEIEYLDSIIVRIKPIHDELTERQERLEREEDERDAFSCVTRCSIK